MAIKPVSVSQLNSYVGRVIGTDPILMNISVCGEIANLTKHSGGHWYFTLKDENSKINCFLASSRVMHLRYDISEGMQIVAYGNVSVYEKGGYYSLNVKDIEVEGQGALQQAFENLKRKLEKEGLFDPCRKRRLPQFPKRIGVVTSPTGAAIRDIITTVKRRNPMVDILIYPALVQGSESAASVVSGIEYMNANYPELDLLIVGRGGGSIEDLWSFNEESVVRAIFASRIPVISAVGHESDTVISDFAADVRAATPTAAAELAVPHIDNYKDRIEHCSPRRMYDSLRALISDCEHRLRYIKLDIDSNNPMNVLGKGYALAKDEAGGWISSADETLKGKKITVLLKDGSLDCIVDEVHANG